MNSYAYFCTIFTLCMLETIFFPKLSRRQPYRVKYLQLYTRKGVNFYSPSPYRAANTLHLGYKILPINPLNAELNPICHLLALLGAHQILHISSVRVNSMRQKSLFVLRYTHKAKIERCGQNVNI